MTFADSDSVTPFDEDIRRLAVTLAAAVEAAKRPGDRSFRLAVALDEAGSIVDDLFGLAGTMATH